MSAGAHPFRSPEDGLEYGALLDAARAAIREHADDEARGRHIGTDELAGRIGIPTRIAGRVLRVFADAGALDRWGDKRYTIAALDRLDAVAPDALAFDSPAPIPDDDSRCGVITGEGNRCTCGALGGLGVCADHYRRGYTEGDDVRFCSPRDRDDDRDGAHEPRTA